MAKGICPECDELVGIIPDKEASRYWRLDYHSDKRNGTCQAHADDRPGKCGHSLPCENHGWPECDGSGVKI